jgi:SAM-dependent methyltransferase
VNLAHRWLCRSANWKETVAVRVPWVLEGLDLGANVLEVGPGYGAATELLIGLVTQLTCVEADRKLAECLRRRALGWNVTILRPDATEMQLPDAAFDAAVCFTMLHHVPSVRLQDRLLAEVARVFRPGGIFAGTDSRLSRRFRLLHSFDTMVVVHPETFPDRLKSAGFEDARVDLTERAFRFRARKAA